jgi:RNA polymerase sigma factor (sigma-70 family)
LDLYLDRMGGRSFLDAREEIRASRALHRCQREQWRILLVDEVSAVPLARALPILFPEFGGRLRAFADALCRGVHETRAVRLARMLDGGDLDRSVLSALEPWYCERGCGARLRRTGSKHVSGSASAGLDPLPRSSSGSSHARFLEKRREARRHMDRLAGANLRLVIATAKRYRGLGLSFEDLIQEGNIGLLKAVQRFDPASGYRFATYAIWWIRSNIQRAIASRGRMVRVPMQWNTLMFKMRKVDRLYATQRGRSAGISQLARELHVGVDQIREIRALETEAPLSLDQPLSDTATESFSDMVAAEDAPSGLDSVAGTEQVEVIEDALSFLPHREREILRRRFGIGMNEEETLASIARDMGVSRERVRQLQNQGLRRMRESFEEGRFEGNALLG